MRSYNGMAAAVGAVSLAAIVAIGCAVASLIGVLIEYFAR